MKTSAFDPKPKDALKAGALHPAGRTGVPGPSAAPDMPGGDIDIGGDHIGLDLIAMRVGAGAGVVDRIEHPEQRGGLVAFAELREAITDQRAAWVYWPPFSRSPADIP